MVTPGLKAGDACDFVSPRPHSFPYGLVVQIKVDDAYVPFFCGIRNLFSFFFQAEDGIRDLVRSRGLGRFGLLLGRCYFCCGVVIAKGEGACAERGDYEGERRNDRKSFNCFCHNQFPFCRLMTLSLEKSSRSFSSSASEMNLTVDVNFGIITLLRAFVRF